MLRTSILYAFETYYNLKENELRSIERIEESYLRQMISTRRFCKISLLYLEFGIWPARFEIMRCRLLFLKYILNQNKKSTIYRFLQIQMQSKLKGDWVFMCLSDLSELKIEMNFEEITIMKIDKFKTLLKEKIISRAFHYLKSNIQNKGKEITYDCLKMAKYLMPNKYLSIEDQKIIFSLRTQTFQISNEDNKEIIRKCICEENLHILHLYECQQLNNNTISIEYNNIFTNKIKDMNIC